LAAPANQSFGPYSRNIYQCEVVEELCLSPGDYTRFRYKCFLC
jgi:hypothetical protein